MTSDFTASLPRKRMGAGALIRDAGGRVLIVEPTYKPTWEIPGGVVETDESPRATCAREIAEELGLDLQPGRLLVHEWQSAPPGGTESIMVVYDGGVLPDDAVLRLPPTELRSSRFVAAADLDEALVPVLARRMRAALRALCVPHTVELVDGTEQPTTPRWG